MASLDCRDGCLLDDTDLRENANGTPIDKEVANIKLDVENFNHMSKHSKQEKVSTVKHEDRMSVQNMDRSCQGLVLQKLYEFFKKKDFDGVQELIQNNKADVNHLFTESFVDVSDRGLALLHFLSQKGDCGRLRLLVSLGADPGIPTRKGETPLHLACKYGQYHCVDFLIQCDKQLVNRVNIQGLTPLMKAIYRFDTAFKEKDYKNTINLLIDAGCDVNLSPESKITPLHVVAGKWKSVKMVEKLIQAGANVNADTGSSSPLLAAVCRQRIDSSTVIALVDAGADVNYRNPNGKSVLHIVVSKSEDICVEHLLKAGADPNIEDQDGNSPLWIAVFENNIKIAPLLLTYGANVNFTNSQHRLTLLAKAAMNSNVKMIKLLLENNADVNITTDLGASALHYAVSNGDITITKLLLSKNCDLENYSSYRNIYNPQNVLQIALELGYGDLIKLLLLVGFPLTEHYVKLSNLPNVVKEDSELVEWIYDYFYTPQPLQHLCCLSLRQYCGSRLPEVVECLTREYAIPSGLSDIILLKHFLDERKEMVHDIVLDWQ